MTEAEEKKVSGAAGSNAGGDQNGPEFLKKLRDGSFESSNEKLALALGRPVEEIERFLNGSEPLDEDVLLKAHGIAQERGDS